eukprot:TRINITY_DN9895_c0_g1_i2.p1 TRINITY_DN9895_c0_g1~~TRINITY_DN9895_c0_g1_i2.p1  ORF type:complete len:325 (+),score=54.88 TRINITY_DN9895_c0_g1_i2:80-1054(+)
MTAPPGLAPANAQPKGQANQLDEATVVTLVQGIAVAEKREQALLTLSKRRDAFPALAHTLWFTPGTIAILIREIIDIYPKLNPPTLQANESNRVCNALALLQCVAAHPDTRTLFLQANIPLFLYPLLSTTSKTRPFEYLRLTSLGVVGALVKVLNQESDDEKDVIGFLLTTEIIPLCLRIMEAGSELSKTVATFIVQKILLDRVGLSYICHTYERFSHVALILGKMVHGLTKSPSSRLLKHVIRCYMRLSDNPRAREALRQCLPEQLRDDTFTPYLKEDTTTRGWLKTLLANLSEDARLPQEPQEGGQNLMQNHSIPPGMQPVE